MEVKFNSTQLEGAQMYTNKEMGFEGVDCGAKEL